VLVIQKGFYGSGAKVRIIGKRSVQMGVKNTKIPASMTGRDDDVIKAMD